MKISELRRFADWDVIPASPGIYKVVSDIGFEPQFSSESSAIHFKGKDPSVDVSVLENNWVKSTDPTQTLYIGKAGGLNQRATLRQRIKAYIKFGNGLKASHWGGRYIWQLENVDELYIEWKTCGIEEDPATLERNMIGSFLEQNEQLPFANLRK